MLSDLEDSDGEFTCLPDPAWSDICPWEQELNPTNLSSRSRKLLRAMNQAFDIVNQCEWIMKSTSRLDPDSLAVMSEASDPNIGPDDRDLRSPSLSPLSACPFPLSPKARTQLEPTPSQYLMSELRNFPDKILADDERDNVIKSQPLHILRRTRSRKKFMCKNKAQDHPSTQYTVYRPLGPAMEIEPKVQHPQCVKKPAFSSAAGRVKSLLSLFEKPSPVPIKRPESFDGSDSTYESGNITVDGVSNSVKDNPEPTRSAQVQMESSSGSESEIQDNSNSVVSTALVPMPHQPLHITPNTPLGQLLEAFRTPEDTSLTSASRNEALTPVDEADPLTETQHHSDRVPATATIVREFDSQVSLTQDPAQDRLVQDRLRQMDSHLTFLAAIRNVPAVSHKFYWTPASSQELDDSWALALCQCRLNETGHCDFEGAAARLGPHSKAKAIKDDGDGDDKVSAELSMVTCCAGCGGCAGQLRQQETQLPVTADSTPQPPPRPLTPYPRPVRPPPRPRSGVPPAADLSFRGDAVYDGMSGSASASEADETMNDIEFCIHNNPTDVSPDTSVAAKSRERITATLLNLDAVITSMLTQVNDLLAQMQASGSKDNEERPEFGFTEKRLAGSFVEHRGAPRKPPLCPTPGQPFPTPPPLPLPRGNTTPPPPRREASHRTMDDDMFPDTMTATDVDAGQDAPWFRIPLLGSKLPGWLTVEGKCALNKTRTSRSASDGVRDANQYSQVSFGQSRVHCHGQGRLLCQAIVAQLLQSH
ncbi:hypothetical protein MVEG_11459 [Podila verticillata NRRL 6337]|uniref:Uncharacterized protein n=1 Tax=Podila verticillata NRRL 6337 TaxID=1069443 RepID=A0A086TLV8_9FUNG|nr:hypothetical protein MVEG_11459 [Podila verticillata NRRL 6337]